jgi:hypothetical protein
MAGAEPAAKLAARLARALAEGDATKMRADPDNDKPLRPLRPLLVRLGIDQCAERGLASRLDIGCRAVIDEHGLTAPDHGNALPFLDWRKIDARRRQGKGICGRIHHMDEGPHGEGRSNGADRCRRDQQEVPSRFPLITMFRRCRRCVCHERNLIIAPAIRG